jgi:uracil-DNA glycosylase family 4
MSERDEFRELIAQALEYARFYRELGGTDLDRPVEQIVVPATPQPANRPVELMAEPVKPVPMPKRSDKSEALPPPPALFTAPVATTSSGETSPAVVAVETLDDIRRDLGDCRRCKLWSTRTNIVFGEGNPQPRLMFVGEGPGADEDQSGRPFIGRAGQLLTKMIEAIGLSRDEVYIANVVKSRPPENRAPERDEVAACFPFLQRQIAVVRPKLIVTLGNPATQALLDSKIGITRLRGLFHDYPRLSGIKVLPTFHPAYLLRSPDKKREAWEDLKKVRDFLQQLPN